MQAKCQSNRTDRSWSTPQQAMLTGRWSSRINRTWPVGKRAIAKPTFTLATLQPNQTRTSTLSTQRLELPSIQIFWQRMKAPYVPRKISAAASSTWDQAATSTPQPITTTLVMSFCKRGFSLSTPEMNWPNKNSESWRTECNSLHMAMIRQTTNQSQRKISRTTVLIPWQTTWVNWPVSKSARRIST